MKTRTFRICEDNYTKEEVMDIISEVIEESLQKGFKQYDKIWIEDSDTSRYIRDFVVEYSRKTPTIYHSSFANW